MLARFWAEFFTNCDTGDKTMKTVKLLAALAAAVSVLFTQGALAQTFPTKPIHLVMPYPPGGSSDILARPIANEMTKSLGQPVLIEYKPGAGSTIGADYIAKSAPDGYTLIMLLTAHAINASLMPKLPYDTVKDFAPVTLAATLPLVVVVNAQSNIHTIQDLIATAKANPGKLNYGSAGPGSASHLGCILLGKAIGADLQHVPYKGTGPAMQDLQAGRLDISCEIVVTAVPQVEARTVKALATLSRDRSPVLPDLPTAYEKGFQNIQVYTWTALMFPKGTPAPIVTKLRDAALKTLAEPEVRRQLQTLGASIVSPDRTTPEYLGKFVQDEIDKWAGPIRDSGAVIP